VRFATCNSVHRAPIILKIKSLLDFIPLVLFPFRRSILLSIFFFIIVCDCIGHFDAHSIPVFNVESYFHACIVTFPNDIPVLIVLIVVV